MVDGDDENPYTPSQKTNSKKKKSKSKSKGKDMNITTANQKLINQTQKGNSKKKELKSDTNHTTKNSHRRTNFITEEIKLKAGKNSSK